MKYLLRITALVCLYPVITTSQEAGPGGLRLTFGLNQRFEATDNRDLSTAIDEAGRESNTRLSFGLLDETRSSSLSLNTATGLRINEDGTDVSDPALNFAFRRNSADAQASITGAWSRSDIAFLRDISDFTDADGVITLPDNFNDLTGNGTRTISEIGASLRWGDTAPVGYSLSVSQRDLRYRNANASLLDSTTTNVAAGVRLDVTPAVATDIGLRFSQFDRQGSPAEETTTLSTGLTLDLPTGSFSTNVTATRQADGDTTYGLNFGRGFELPGIAFNARLGLTQDSAGDAQTTGQLSYGRELPTGAINISLSQALATGGANDGRRTTTLQAGYAQDVTALGKIQLQANYARAVDFDGTELATGSLSASYGVKVTPDWQINLGARADLRDDDTLRTRANTVFVGLDRSFTYWP